MKTPETARKTEQQYFLKSLDYLIYEAWETKKKGVNKTKHKSRILIDKLLELRYEFSNYIEGRLLPRVRDIEVKMLFDRRLSQLSQDLTNLISGKSEKRSDEIYEETK